MYCTVNTESERHLRETLSVIETQINRSVHKGTLRFTTNALHLKYNQSADIRSTSSPADTYNMQLLKWQLLTLNFRPLLEHQRDNFQAKCLCAIGAGWTKSGCKDNVLNKHTQHCCILMDIFTNIPTKYPTGYKKGRLKTVFSI